MQAIQEMMRKSGCSEPQIKRFCSRVEAYLSGSNTAIPEAEIEPVQELAHLNDIEPDDSVLRQVAVIKLNGGLGTSMGLTGPKGLLTTKNGHDFYSILVNQLKRFEARYKFRPPLIFMNSFSTEAETNERLQKLGFEQDVPWSFLQSQVPKIKPDGTLPETDEDWAWCPPGHGDIYASLMDSGLLDTLKEKGIRYLFVSNIDNLGAVPDSRPAAYMDRHRLSFLMEVTRRGENDKKGGHLARDLQGDLLLREVAQCPESDLNHFQNIDKHRYFNTNNLWIDLHAIDESWTRLPLIVNKKPVKPHQPDSEKVVQLEQAMGAAIGEVDAAGAIEVGRERFAPVKTTNELFLLRSDLYELDEDYHVRQVVEQVPRVELDPKYFKLISDFEQHVSEVPSLKECTSLKVEGPVLLSGDLVLRGDVHLKA